MVKLRELFGIEEVRPEPIEKVVSKTIVKPKKIVLADRKKNKFQIADKVYELLVNDAKRPKDQQKILIEKYRSTLKDLELYEVRK